MGGLTAPTPIGGDLDVADFDCGEESLDRWLRERARRSEASGAARTYAVCEGASVVGYYCLAVGGILREVAPGRVRRNMPESIPVAVLGRLAVTRRWQGRGVGFGLIKDAVLRTYAAAEHVGIRALLVRALTAQAREFYLRAGFVPSPVDSMLLLLPLVHIRAVLEDR